MKVSIQCLLIILLPALIAISCKKIKNVPSTTGIPIIPMDALYNIEDQQLIIYSATGDVMNYNLKNNKIIKQIATHAYTGYCAIGTYNGKRELYYPRADGWLFIYDATTLSEIDKINIGNQLFSVVYNNGILYVSLPNHINNSVCSYSRATKSKISEATMGGDYLHLKMIPGSNTELFAVSRGCYYVQFDNMGNWLTTNTTFASHTTSPYQMDYNLCEIYPDGTSFISTSSGIIFSKDFQYVSTLPYGSYSFTSFDFDETNRRIYAGSTQNNILAYSMDSYELTKTINTHGTPRKIFFDNGSLISVSTITVTINQLPAHYDSTITIVERVSDQ